MGMGALRNTWNSWMGKEAAASSLCAWSCSRAFSLVLGKGKQEVKCWERGEEGQGRAGSARLLSYLRPPCLKNPKKGEKTLPRWEREDEELLLAPGGGNIPCLPALLLELGPCRIQVMLGVGGP